MNQPAFTMPEAKFRSTKRGVLPASKIRTSEFSHEAKALRPEQKTNAEAATPAPLKAKNKQNRISIVSIWPVAVGIFLSGFASEWYAMATQAGAWATRFTFPYSLLAVHHATAVHGALASMPASALLLQIPIDGLLMTIALICGRSLKSTIGMLLFLHAVLSLVLWQIAVGG